MLSHRISLCLCFSFFIDACLSKKIIYIFCVYGHGGKFRPGRNPESIIHRRHTTSISCWMLGVIEGQMYIAVMSTHFTSQVTYSPS